MLRTAATAAIVYLAFYIVTQYVLPTFVAQSPAGSALRSAGGVMDLTSLIREVKTQVGAATSRTTSALCSRSRNWKSRSTT